jgi:hypothetical protein
MDFLPLFAALQLAPKSDCRVISDSQSLPRRRFRNVAASASVLP